MNSLTGRIATWVENRTKQKAKISKNTLDEQGLLLSK